jgi:hypothetical protein
MLISVFTLFFSFTVNQKNVLNGLLHCILEFSNLNLILYNVFLRLQLLIQSKIQNNGKRAPPPPNYKNLSILKIQFIMNTNFVELFFRDNKWDFFIIRPLFAFYVCQLPVLLLLDTLKCPGFIILPFIQGL